MKSIGFKGGKQTLKINGSAGAKFNVKITNEDGLTYDFVNNVFNSANTILRKQTIGSSGIYNLNFTAPVVSDDDTYDVIIQPIGTTTKGKNLAKEETTLTIHQYGSYPEFLFDASSGTGTFTLASALTTGVKVIGLAKSGGKYTWTNTGAITKGSAIIYLKKDGAEWGYDDGTGDFTNVFKMEKTVDGDGVGTKFALNNTTNLASGMYVTGEFIRGENVTISSIPVSGVVVLSSSQKLSYGDKLTFTNGRWEHETIHGAFSGSGTTSLTLTISGVVNKIGVTNITSMLDVDGFVQSIPNAFPLKMNGIRGTEVEVDVKTPDTDANSSAKTYKLHSAPAGGEGTITQTNGDAISSGNTITSGKLTYTVPSGLSDVGETYTFVYKCTDAAGGNSSTTTGIISITVTASETTATELDN